MGHDGGKFGPFAGQMFVGEINHQRLVRVMLEKVGGEWQGACVPFHDAANLPMGSNRLAFAPDGSLFVGLTKRQSKWSQGSTGLFRLVWTGKTPMDVLEVSLREKGFDLSFTRPLDPATASRPSSYRVKRYYYRHHRFVGSPQYEVVELPVRGSGNVRRPAAGFPGASRIAGTGRIYQFDLVGIRAEDGSPLLNPMLAYTLNRLRDGKPPPAQPRRPSWRRRY